MLTSFIALAVASFVFMFFAQTRWIGALGTIIIIFLNPLLFIGMAAMGGIVYYFYRKRE